MPESLVETLTSENATITTKLNKKCRKLETLKTKICNIEDELQTARSGAFALQNCDSHLIELEASVDTLKTENATMKSQLNKKRNEAHTMKAKISNLERELAATTAASQHAPKTRNAYRCGQRTHLSLNKPRRCTEL